MYHNSKLSKFAFRTKTGLKWPFFAQTIPFFVLCFITNIYIWYIVGSGISRSERLQYFQIHKRYVTFLIMLFVYFSCQGRSFMLTATCTNNEEVTKKRREFIDQKNFKTSVAFVQQNKYLDVEISFLLWYGYILVWYSISSFFTVSN